MTNKHMTTTVENGDIYLWLSIDGTAHKLLLSLDEAVNLSWVLLSAYLGESRRKHD